MCVCFLSFIVTPNNRTRDGWCRVLAKKSKLGGLLQTNVFLCSKPNLTNARSLLRGGVRNGKRTRELNFWKKLKYFVYVCMVIFCLCFTTSNITTQQNGSTWKSLRKPSEFISMWGFLMCTGHLCGAGWEHQYPLP